VPAPKGHTRGFPGSSARLRCAKLLPRRGEQCCTQAPRREQGRAVEVSLAAELARRHRDTGASHLSLDTHTPRTYTHFLQVLLLTEEPRRCRQFHVQLLHTREPQIRDTMLKMVPEENWNEDFVKCSMMRSVPINKCTLKVLQCRAIPKYKSSDTKTKSKPCDAKPTEVVTEHC